MRTALVTSCVFVAVLCLSSCCCVVEFDKDWEGYKSEFERSYSIASGGEVEVRNIDGSVHVDSWDKDEVLVKGTLRVRAKNEEEARKRMGEVNVVISQDDNALSIEIKRKKRRSQKFWFDCSSWRVDLELTVPEKCSLSLSSVDGGIRVTGVSGTHALTTVDGSVYVESVQGDIKSHSVDGSCILANVEGRVDVGTTDGTIEGTGLRGDIRCESVDGSCILADIEGSVSVSTIDGRIRIEGILSDVTATAINGSIGIAALEGSDAGGDWKISTVDGSVTLVLPEFFSTDLRASTTDGRVSVSMPAEFQIKTKRSVVATLGDGGGVISISTTDGSIRVRQLEAE